MTRWLVDFRVASDLLPEKENETLTFRDTAQGLEIHLRPVHPYPAERVIQANVPDEYPLAVRVVLNGEVPAETKELATTILRRFLDLLAFATGSHYRITRIVRIVDWTPGLTTRRGLQFDHFPNPNTPQLRLSQDHVDSVARFMAAGGPAPAVNLAVSWWAHAVASERPREQFHYFWFCLEVLAEFRKPTNRVPDRCARCREPLFCRTCNEVPTHRPYPKQAIQALILDHVADEPEAAFTLVDEARNRLLHGEKPEDVERALARSWQQLSDLLGRIAWAALLSVLREHVSTHSSDDEPFRLLSPTTFAHYKVTLTTDLSLGYAHKDPENPRVEELSEPGLRISMNVMDRRVLERAQSAHEAPLTSETTPPLEPPKGGQP